LEDWAAYGRLPAARQPDFRIGDFECLLSPIAAAQIKEKLTKRQTGNGQPPLKSKLLSQVKRRYWSEQTFKIEFLTFAW